MVVVVCMYLCFGFWGGEWVGDVVVVGVVCYVVFV